MHRDVAYMMDIVLAVEHINSYLDDVTESTFYQNVLLQDAVIRRLEIIGEAARRISASTKEEHPEIPWSDMIGMRNFMIHEYSKVNIGIVWEAATSELDALCDQLRIILNLPPS